MTTKTQAVLDYLLQSPAISAFYYQYADARAGAMQISGNAVDRASRRQYVDGSQQKRLDYTFTWYRPLACVPVIAGAESIDSVAASDDVQGIIDWIDAQDDARHYPELGAQCIVDRITCTTDTPRLAGIDTSSSPVLAQYQLTIRLEYLDMSGCVWGETERSNA